MTEGIDMKKNRRIAIVNENFVVANVIALQLKTNYKGLIVLCFRSLNNFIKHHEDHPFDVCIIDLHLNEKTNIIKMLLPKIRAKNHKIKLIYVSNCSGKTLGCIQKNGTVDINKITKEIEENVTKMEKKSSIELSILSMLSLVNIEKTGIPC